MPFATKAKKQEYDKIRRKRPDESLRRKQRVLALSAAFKIRVILYKGGKCKKCGYDKCHTALDLHHIDHTQKEFNINEMRNKAWGTVIKELDKCDLLCSTCHREIHFDAQPIERALEYLSNRNDKYLGDKELTDFTEVIEYMRQIVNHL